MEEDVLGTMRTIHASTSAYVECSRCSKMIRQEDAHLLQGTALDGLSEYEQLCPECYAAAIQGNEELPAEP
ncbi:MAG TPA: hypothetical protein VF818_03470 [Ktedonobacterales bacterium]